MNPIFQFSALSDASGRRQTIFVVLAVVTVSSMVQDVSAQKVTPRAKAIHLEAEAGTLHGTTVSTTRTGFSGTGYVNGLDKEGDRIVWQLPDAVPGLYDVRLRYCAPDVSRGYEISVNGAKSSGMMPRTGEGFASTKIGKVELLPGLNTLAIEKGWGNYDVDAIDLTPAGAPTPLKRIPLRLSNAAATPKTRALMAYLLQQYGKHTISGQQQTDPKKDDDVKYIAQTTGKTPGVLGGDFIEYSPTRVERGAKPEGVTEMLIEGARKGHIVTAMWHWNAPADLIDNEKYVNAKGETINALWWRGFYSDATTFDLEKVLAEPQSAKYQLLIRDMDVIATELKKLQAADIPVLWRPLHEAEGGWFWWGAKGPQPFKKLWRLMFDRFTNYHKLNNLIWVYTSGGKADWYPGDAYVDIVGADVYQPLGTPMSGIWEELRAQFDGKKMLTLSETGDLPDVDKMRRYGVTWSYFMSWENFPKKPATDLEKLFKKTYNSPLVLNRGDVSIASSLQRTQGKTTPSR